MFSDQAQAKFTDLFESVLAETKSQAREVFEELSEQPLSTALSSLKEGLQRFARNRPYEFVAVGFVLGAGLGALGAEQTKNLALQGLKALAARQRTKGSAAKDGPSRNSSPKKSKAEEDTDDVTREILNAETAQG